MANILPYSTGGFGGGVNDFLTEDNIASNETTNLARNIRIYGNRKKPRKGYITIADTLVGVGIQGISSFSKNDTNPDLLACVQNGNLETLNPDVDGSWSPLAVDNLKANGEVNMIDYNGYLFLLDGINKPKRIAKSSATPFTDTLDTTTKSLTANQMLAQKFTIATGSGLRLTSITVSLKASAVSGQAFMSIYNFAAGAPTTKIQDFGDRIYFNASINKITQTDQVELADGDYALVITDAGASAASTVVYEASETTEPELFNNGSGWVAQTKQMYAIINGESIAFVSNTDITKPDAIANANDFAPAWGIASKGSLWLGGVPGYENTIFLARAGTLGHPEYSYDFSGTLGTASNADAFKLSAVGTAVREMGDMVVMFDKRSAYLAQLVDAGTFVVKPISGSQGAANFRATVCVENDVYYLTPQNEIKSVKRATAQNITAVVYPASIKINKFLKGLSINQSKAWAMYDQTEKLVKFYLQSEGSDYTDVCVVGDLKSVDSAGNFPWTIDSNKPFSCGVFFNGKAYCGSAFIGQVYQDEIGLADDNDAHIMTYLPSKDFTVDKVKRGFKDSATTFKRWHGVEIHGGMTASTNILVNIYCDDVLVKTGTMSGSVLDNTNSMSGIGTFGIGMETIGVEGNLDISSQLDFTFRFEFRSTGKKLRIDMITDGINQDYVVHDMNINLISLSRLYVPGSEKI